MRTLYTAELVLPMGGREPIHGGGVVVDETGRIVQIGRLREMRPDYDRREDHAALLPGVVNCHVHLTDARRETPVPGGDGLNAWVRRLLAARSAESADDAKESAGTAKQLDEAIAGVLAEMSERGTVAVGEVANSYATLDVVLGSGVRCRFMHELIAFGGDRTERVIAEADALEAAAGSPADVMFALAAHAPYSVSPRLMSALARRAEERSVPLYQHLAEDPAERELYETGGGAWREFLEEFGVWDPSFVPPGVAPIRHYADLGILNERFVAVHLADATADELRLLQERGVRAILSPASNLHITGLLPDFETIVRRELPFGFGTDGRGSNTGIDVLDEARIMFERWYDLRPGIFLEALTSVGAGILEFPELGTLAPGMRPGVVATDVAPDARTVAELERELLGRPARLVRLL